MLYCLDSGTYISVLYHLTGIPFHKLILPFSQLKLKLLYETTLKNMSKESFQLQA